MRVLGTVRELLEASTASANRGSRTEESDGAYWCDDCSERLLDNEVEGESPPACPSCGKPMTFERSPGSTGCAC